MPVFVDRDGGPVLAPCSGMMCSRYALVALVLMAAACGGSVNTAIDGTGGGTAVGGSGGGTGVGGAGGGTGGTSGSTGGSDAATSDGNSSACTSDSDCTQCVYTAAPTNATECDGVLGCCGGQVMNKTTCSANQAAWNATCSRQSYTIPSCPCMACGNCSLGCLHGECGFWPKDSGAAGTGGTGGSGVVTTLPLCAWPASFDSADATVGQCAAARFYLSCKGSNGGGMACMSNSATECPGPNATPGVSYSNCENQCQPNEYALGCGGPGPGPWPQPPVTCRTLPYGPGGGSVSCCPCGS
jgi:hypothetical protein